MNFVDYQGHGCAVGVVDVLAGIAGRPGRLPAAWPVNYWLLKRELKACH